MTTLAVVLASGPLLGNGMSSVIGLFAIVPVLALVGFFVFAYKRDLDRQAREQHAHDHRPED